MFTDHHLHTHFSHDSNEVLPNITAAARLRGLGGVVVTDHVDMPDWEDITYVYNPRRDEVYAEVELARELNPDLYIGFGVELGNELFDPARARETLGDSRLDFVIGSMHTRTDGRDYHKLSYLSLDDCHRELARYCAELLDYCRSADFDVLGHLTYPLRYMLKAGYKPDFTLYRDAITECFKLLIERGKGLECNTSGLRKHMKETQPNAYWLKLFRSMGGEIVTLASDAHTAQEVGADFNEAAELLSLCGFDHVAVFKKRSPAFIKI